MKKKLIILSTVLFLHLPLSAQVDNGYTYEKIELSCSKVDVENGHDSIHRTPPRAPEVYIDGNTLFFADSCDGCTLQLLLPESDVVVFSTVIAPGTTALTLPYEGEYELRIIYGDYYFQGTIEI